MAEASAVASRFGQRLAHTEKKYRDQALKKLTKYLAHKREWTALDWDKLWKALFYCMWMSDKRPVQLELAQNLAALVHVLPSRTLALEFVHSFFRTMHREWHGLDGLRLDKFYDLVRQFVRQTLALLAKHKFARAAVSEFVSILSTEVVSQRPNGLRMHLADLYLAEISNAVGDSVPTGAFLLLLEPFFTLLSSEYDKSVFQRVRELVFLPMLSEYKFGKQEEKSEDGETDEDSGDDTTKVFPNVDLARVQHRIFAIAAAEDTAERNRSALYSLYGKFAAVTEVDSLKASQEEPAVQDDDMPDADEDEAKEQPTEAAADSEQKKKKKNKKKRKQADAEATPVQEESEKPKEEEAPPAKKQKKSKKDKETVEEQPKVVTPEKKQKKSKKELKEVAKEVKETPKESPKKVQQDEEVAEKPKKKKAKKQEQEVEVAKEEKKAKVAEETKKEKKAKGEKKETKSTDEPKKAKTAEEGKKEKKDEEPKEEKKAKPAMIIKSGVKFQRCAGCGGFGKKLLRPGKDVCGHCERTRKTQKKVAAKKRKAESDAKVEAEESNTPAKKVTFGKNKALPHSLSVKRLKASAKKDAVPKDADIKGVLKASATTPDVKSSTKGSKGKSSDGKNRRAKASDFF